ncbi:YheC/YheD family protein [Alicyclobacillus sp.]|uniref:YheC/YheD family protein n=1 Tax=Alicyclobacillus sp. TaxID=61169 RepID=UPI0025B9C494|nr:YheC/YheD family protein [Alicyclobacillus sp.]MCL6516242.1 YheC/YheD family protein [Alicyclobacillus sp.]
MFHTGGFAEEAAKDWVRLGLYASLEPNVVRPFGEQTRMFADLWRIGQGLGVEVVVLVPGYARTGRGYLYDHAADRWRPDSVPLPSVVYRRSGSFRAPAALVREDLALFHRRGVLHTLPRAVSNKWTFYRLLTADAALQRYVPWSRLASGPQDVYRALLEVSDVYVKPLGGAQGISVYRLRWKGAEGEARWEERIVPRRTERITQRFQPFTRLQLRRFRTPAEFRAFWGTTKLGRCLVQETVELPRTRDGRPFDFRWLIQYADEARVLARVARVGRPEAVTTNIHTGGQAVPADTALRGAGIPHPDGLLGQLDAVALLVADRLRRKYGPYAEVGVDLALRPDLTPVVFEVNPTPGRRMLRSLERHVRELSLETLIEYAIRATRVQSPGTTRKGESTDEGW